MRSMFTPFGPALHQVLRYGVNSAEATTTEPPSVLLFESSYAPLSFLRM